MDTRKADLEQLRQAWHKDPSQREHIEEAGRKIYKENKKIRSMRESLVKAHRDGNIQNIKDIHEYIKGRKDYAG